MSSSGKDAPAWRVQGGARLGGRVAVPGDKSIGHRAVLFGALCDGPVEVTGLSGGEDNRSTMGVLRALGVRIDEPARGQALVHGVGLRGLGAPAPGVQLDCGNSGTSMRLFSGLLAGQPFAATMVGDESLSKRPMKRVVTPLTEMGARFEGRPGAKPGELLPPLTVHGGALRGIRYVLPMASAQVKSAVLIAGLFARGVTEVVEPGPTRDHTERMLARLGAPLTQPAPLVARVAPDGWDGRLVAQPLAVPGDPSSAAFLIVAALLAGAGEVVVEGVGVNPTRTGFLDALAAMGARVEQRNLREACGEPVADLVVAAGAAASLVGAELGGDLVVRAIDEIPVLAVLAARARGTTVVRDAHELRVKESDRVVATLALLRSFGVRCEERDDGLVVHGDPDAALTPGSVDAVGDHRIAMSAAVLGLVAPSGTVVRDVANVATSFPSFRDLMARLGGTIDVTPAP